MLKKIASLLIIVSLSVSTLTGCTFIVPLVKEGIEDLKASIGEERSDSEDSKRNSNEGNEESNKEDQDINKNGQDINENGQDMNAEEAIKEILTSDESAINGILYKIWETEYQPSPFVQDDVESDTVQWICATYALYNELNNKDYYIVGGYPDAKVSESSPNSEHYEKVTEYLKNSNGVEDRKTAVMAIYVLLNVGISEKYNLEAQEMVANGDIDKDLIKEYKRSPEVFRKLAVQKAYHKFGEKGLLGWDLSKANQVLGDCYYAGYINLEECLDLSLLISERIQESFESWDEFCESYLYGQQFVRQDAVDNPSTDTANEWENYEQMKSRAKEDRGPFVISFKTELANNWSEEVRAAKQEAKEEAETIQMEVPKEDAEGLITLYTGVEDLPGLKMRVPDGYTMADFSTALGVYATREDNQVSILYNIDLNSGFDSIKEKFEEDKKLSMEVGAKDLKIINDKFDEGKDEVIYYYAIETKGDGVDGMKMIDYRGYKARKIDDMWIGIHAQLITNASVKITEKEAVSLMFSDIKFP